MVNVNIGGTEIVVIFIIVLIAFGPKRLPEVARFLSRVAREIRSAVDEIKREIGPHDIFKG